MIRSRNRNSPLTDALIFCGAPPKTRLPEASSGQASHDRDEVRELFAAVQIRPVEHADAALSDEPTKLQCDRQAAHGSIVSHEAAAQASEAAMDSAVAIAIRTDQPQNVTAFLISQTAKVEF